MVNLVDGKPYTELSPDAITAIWAARAYYEHQADVVLNQANPTSALEYAVLPATTYVRLISVWLMVTWTVQPDLQGHITIDGNNITGTSAAPVTATDYYMDVYAQLSEAAQWLQLTQPLKSFLYEGKSVAVTAETTGGTTQNLDARAKYARYIP